jgi:ABC-2 type transport system permease protein
MTASTTDMPSSASARRVRPFYWSLRRELWENRGVYLAPLAIAAIVLAGFLYSSHTLVHTVLAATAPNAPAKAVAALNIPYAAAAGSAYVISLVVAVFYCLGALHGERRDRSLLFWKSLPVSDLQTVLAKALVAMVIQPLVALVVGFGAQFIMLAWGTAVLAINGADPGLLWSHVKLPFIWAMFPYGVVLNTLWTAPVLAWLLLVSAWAKRMTFVWGVAPWLALSLFEFLAFHTHHVWSFLDARINGGLAEAYTVGGLGKAPVLQLSQIDPLRFLANPGLWVGLVIAAACLAGCVWLRRTRDPI